MSVELKLYSPLQVDVIDRDISSQSVPLRAADPERGKEYLSRVLRVFKEIQSQEDARNAFAAPEQDWSEICEKINSCTRSVELINGRLYGVYSCQSKGALDPEDINSLKWYCRDQWEQGWGEGYAHCPREGSSRGLYIHFWQDADAPLVTRDQIESVPVTRPRRSAVTEIDPNTFWTLIAQAKAVCGQDQRASAYWLTEGLLAMEPEQALNFHGILHAYMELANKYGLWNAATLIQEDGCYSDGFEDFRAWLIAQGKETYLAALKDPDSLVDVPAYGNCRFEALLYVGGRAYERMTGRVADDEVAPVARQQLMADLREDIVYGAGIEYPHEWKEVAAYLPRLCAAHTTPEELQACARRGCLWNHNDPGIQKARAASKKKRFRQNKGGEAR